MQPLSLHFKTFDPHLPPLVARPRLLDRLRRQPAQGLILVQGQAAQGKTGLVADFLRSGQTRVAWIGIDCDRGDAESLFRQLTEALRQIGVLPGPRGIRPPAAPGSASPDERPWRRRLQQLLPGLPEGLDIVVDGLDRLGDHSPAQDLLRELCLQSASRCRLWLLSRRATSFAPLHAGIDPPLLTLDNADLAFTPAETDLYFRTVHEMDPAPDWIERVHQLTDGWCGGLVLISRLMAQQLRTAVPDVDENLVNALSCQTFAFFEDNVFGTIPAPHRLFLLQAAATEVIDPDLLGRLPGMEEAPALLEYLVGNTGFLRVVYDDSGRRRRYRMNPLFQRFLGLKFEAAATPHERALLYQRLGRLYDHQGDLATAVALYFKAGKISEACAAIQKVGIDLVIKGELPALETWLARIGPERVRRTPRLFLLLTLARRIKGQARSVDDFLRVWEQFCASEDLRGKMITAAFLIEALVFQGRSPRDVLTWIHIAEELLAAQGQSPYFAWAKLLLWLNIGFGYIAAGLNPAKGLSASRNALLLARRMGNQALITQADIVFSLGLTAGGQYAQARQRLSALEPATGPLPLLVYDVLKRLAGAEIDMRHGDFAAADEMLRAARDDIETQGLAFLYPAYVEASGWRLVFDHRYEQARQTARHLLDVSVLAGNPLLKASAHRLGGLIDYHGRKYSLSGAEAGHALAIIGCQEPDTLQAMRVLQLQAMACHHLGKGREALPLLDRVLGYFEATGMPQARAETHLMLALVQHGQDAPACRRHLDQGLALLPQDGFNPFTILSPADLETIGTLAGRDMGGTGRLSSRGEDFPSGPDPSAPASTTVFSTVDWCRAAPGWLDIRTFGGFAVLRDGENPIPEHRWRGSRPKLLLKSLLVHGLREIPKDVVIDNLWPESHPRSAYQNFKVTLHRLRKILEPGLEKNKSSAFIQLKDNLLSLNKARCRVDLESFLTCCKDIKRHAIGGQPDRIAALGHELVTLYQGDFLPEEPYAPWVEMKRWALRDTYFDAILRVCAAHRDLGQPEAAADCCRAALQIDPFQERIIRELIQLYLLVGRQKDACDVFERYRAALKQEMDLEPDAATLALAGKLRRPSTSGA